MLGQGNSITYENSAFERPDDGLTLTKLNTASLARPKNGLKLPLQHQIVRLTRLSRAWQPSGGWLFE